jgi:dienelactone hydrolase
VNVDVNALNDFAKGAFTSPSGRRHDVLRLGTGPAVIVIHEVPGITSLVAAFARRVAERGMTAVLPDLFGTPGREVTNGYLVTSMARACVSREFTVLATNRTSPVVGYLRALAAHELRPRHERGPGRRRARVEPTLPPATDQHPASP